MSNPEGAADRRLHWPGRAPYVLTLFVAAATVTLIAYARGLALPYFSDDFVQIEWLRGLSFVDLWTQVSPYDYYRPLAFSLWLIWRSTGLPLTPMGLRLLTFGGHILVSALTGLLAQRVHDESSPLVGALATILFAAYPFAYQAVIWVSAIFYPLVTALMVASMLAYIEARRTGKRRWLIASLLLAGIPPFAHETGVLTGTLILAAELLLPRQDTKRSAWPLAPLGLNALYLLLWFAIRTGGVSTIDLSLPGLLGNLTILITGLTYPVMPLAPLLASIGLPVDAAIWLLSLPLIATIGLLMRLRWRALAFAGIWFALCIGPALVTMRPDWLADAPRFLYPAGVGAAIGWAFVIEAAIRQLPLKRRAVPASIISGLLLAILIPALFFITRGIDWHARGGSALWAVSDAARDFPDRPLLLINLPNEGHPQQVIYPRFNGGATLLPPQVPSPTLARIYHPDRISEDQALIVGAILPFTGSWTRAYGVVADIGTVSERIKDGYVVYIANYDQDDISLTRAGIRLVPKPSKGPALAYFGDFISLKEAGWQFDGEQLTVSLVWDIIAPVDGTPTVFIHVVNGAGEIIAQLDGDPVGGLFPFSAVDEWIILADHRSAWLGDQAPFAVYVGLWDPATGERLTTRGGIFPDDRVPIDPTTD